ncbi:LEF-1 [Olene mendosa nucleopolyhedrovirus]|uniref:LEF-1 n=1 Tax=Olene mendosa nucleopolyhedrovirus TaxID=2933796 RepID=A0AAX3AVT5_9ABAC|nr:LEF-1 [Olene mendosa nucleopolyhedrovirus]UOQ18893.1 LEF-1 [Olene mendosa nucleopolyhedrovirus]
MLKFNKSTKYTAEQTDLMWNSIAFREHRHFAFFDGARRWEHPQRTFATSAELHDYLCANSISDVHVKPLPDNGGREWVLDVDFEADTEPELLDLKIRVACRTFAAFFGNNVARILHSGNRGVHVWLKLNEFRPSADKSLRERHYKAFVKPTTVDLTQIAAGSFIGCLRAALRSPEIKAAVARHFAAPIDEARLILELWPPVDKHVFCNRTQIRAPFSYNYKGKKHQRELWPERC